jgi:hypothetical protein
MTDRFFKLTTPWRELFDTDIIGDGPQAHSFLDDGVPMRFAHIQYGQKRADIGFTVRINGVDVDVTSLWAAKDTASYIADGAGIPELIEDIRQAPTAPVSALIHVSLRRDGQTVITPASAPVIYARWTGALVENIGDRYEVEITVTSSNNKGLLTTLALNSWRRMQESIEFQLSSQKVSGQGMEEALRGIRLRFRIYGSVAIVATAEFDMRALAQVINEG